ncbi:MAG: hypothetical protein V4684_05160 [Pseudomonadota bacterium]
MDFLLLLPVALVALWFARARQQRRRIAILTRYLSGHDIEKNIETLSQGYLRALGESEPGRSEQVWGVLRGTEDVLCRQVCKLAEDFAGVEPTATRVSKFPVEVRGIGTHAGQPSHVVRTTRRRSVAADATRVSRAGGLTTQAASGEPATRRRGSSFRR